MDMAWMMSLIGFGIAMGATPGPNNVMGTAAGANWGVRRALPLVGGIAGGVAIIIFLVTAFGAGLVARPEVGQTLKWLGAAYLLWMAWKIACARPQLQTRSQGAETQAPGFLHGALMQVVNPKLWAMASGAVMTWGQKAGPGHELQLGLIFASVFGICTLIGTFGWSVIGAMAGRLLSSPKALRAFNLAMAALLVASLIPILLK